MESRVDFHFDGRTAIVTGAARGIGAACAERLVRDGAAVALWDIDTDALADVAQRLTARGGDVSVQRCDVADKRQVDAALAATLDVFGRIDGLINNAGIFRAAPFLEIDEADWDAVIATNLKGAFLVGQAVARAMVASGVPGAIVNMSSVNGTTAIAEIASYNVSKGGVNQLTRAMALALAGNRIRVNAVAPGTIATDLARRAVLGSEAAGRRIISRTPLGRLGDPLEVADVCAFLLSDAASYMTGEIVYVDGGRMALNYTMPG